MDSFLERARGFRKKVSEWGLKNLVWVKKEAKKQIWSNLKGSRRDPLFYLGIISVILFGTITFSNPSFVSNNSLLMFIQGSQAGDSFAVPGIKIQESPDLSLIQKNSLAAISPPIMVTPQVLGALITAADYEWTQKEVVEYLVQPGDNLWSIAEKFNISLDTILWANDLNKYTLLQIGQN